MTDLGLIIFLLIVVFFMGMILSAAYDERKQKKEEMKLRLLREELESERRKVRTLIERSKQC